MARLIYAGNYDNAAAIAPAGYTLVNPGNENIFRYNFFNEFDVLNTSGEEVELRINGNPQNKYVVQAGERLVVEVKDGQRFKWIFIYNNDAVNTIAIGELKINIRRVY